MASPTRRGGIIGHGSWIHEFAIELNLFALVVRVKGSKVICIESKYFLETGTWVFVDIYVCQCLEQKKMQTNVESVIIAAMFFNNL